MARPHTIPGRIAEGLLAVLFVAGIGAPLATRLATGEGDGSVESELRKAAPEPELSAEWEALEAYPEGYEAWFADTFNHRGKLIRWHNAFKLLGLGVSPTGDVVVGREGWLFYRGEGAVDSWRALRPFTKGQLETWRRVLEARRDWCRARDMAYRFHVAPNKHTVYPEYLPAWMNRVNEATRLDQLVAHLGATSDLRIVDVREALAAAKGEGLLYFEHGTHWNDRGAYIAYRAILESLSSEIDGLEPVPRDRFRVIHPGWSGDTWATKLLVADLLTQEAIELEPLDPRRSAIDFSTVVHARTGQFDGVMRNVDPGLPRMLLLRDSFANWLYDFLGEHFSWLRTESVRGFDANWIEDEAPDAVVQEIVERKLTMPVPPMPASPRAIALSRRWLAAAPWEPGAEVPKGHELLLRARLVTPQPGRLRATWRKRDGGEATRSFDVRAGRPWVIEPLAGRQFAGELGLEILGQGEVLGFELRLAPKGP